MSSLLSSMLTLLLLASSAASGRTGPVGSGVGMETAVASTVAVHCRPLHFGIAGASTLWNDDEIDGFTGETGLAPHYVHGFVRLGDTLPVAGIVDAEARGQDVIVTLEPWFLDTVADRPLRRLAEGAFDDLIRATADRFSSLDASPILRFAHEMNGNWYPWGRGQGGNQPQDYVDAFRRTVQIFDEQGVTNVRWMWSPNAVSPRSAPLAEYYPGDDVVDLLGFSGYNGGAEIASMGGWLSPSQLFATTLTELESLADKPIVVAETAAARIGGDRPAWVVDLVATLRSYRQVVGFVWFEVAKEADWRLADDHASIDQLERALRGCSPAP